MVRLIVERHLNWAFVGRMLRWHLGYYLLGRGKPVSAGVYITDACNCRCVMCDVWKQKSTSTYPRDAQERAIAALAKAGCFYYSISGGEPTLVPDLAERLAFAARRIPYVRIVTNGLTMTAERARDLGTTGIKEIGLSIDGSEEMHNRMRGRKDAFERAMAALECLGAHAPGVAVVVNSVLTRYNIDALDELGRVLDANRRVRQKFLPLTFHSLFRNEGAGGLPFEEEPASQERIEAFLDKAIATKRVVNSPVFLRKAKRFFAGEQDILPEQRACLYSYHAMEFDAEGYAYPCLTGTGPGAGVPPDTDLSAHMQSADYRESQRELRGCTRCRGVMPLCYYEPRLNFPLHHLVASMFRG